MVAWYEDDELWTEFDAVLSAGHMLTAASREARQTADLLHVEKGARLLDLCCGPGRHAVELARLGYRVTGVDRTKFYLTSAAERAASAGVDIEWVNESMLQFRREEAFDGAINLFSSFGYFERSRDNLLVLQNIRNSLRPGGSVAIDLMGKEVLARIFAQKDWQEIRAGRVWLQERQVMPGWERVWNRWVFLGAGERKEFQFQIRVYSGAELVDLLHRAGFEKVTLCGALDGRPYDSAALRLVAVAQR